MVAVVFAVLMESAAQDAVRPADSARVAPVTLSSAELQYLEKQLRVRSTGRFSADGIRYEVRAPHATQQGLVFGSGSPETPSPISWSEIDTVWVHENRVTTFALLGAVLGAVIGANVGDADGAGEYEGLARISSTTGGIVLGAAAGIVIGRAIHTWRRVYPVNPAKLSRGWSLF